MKFISVSVVKGGAEEGNPHAVDAVSGGTITSKGLEDMLKECLGSYETYFKLKMN
ncbi:MAG: FMN-binding protein [Bacteroidales bacterium]|nr:FMN-binding protein [Bacteroidales bacterium]